MSSVCRPRPVFSKNFLAAGEGAKPWAIQLFPPGNRLNVTKKRPPSSTPSPLATGDAKTVGSLLADGYIQHNLAYGTGANAFIGSVEYLASASVKTTVKNIRAFEDGDKVFLQTIYNFAGAGEQVTFDIFRFDEDGKIVEHWDVMETIADRSAWQNPNGKF